MNNVIIGKGKLAGKGLYAARNFKKGEIVKFWNTKELTQAEFDALPEGEQMFVHSFWGKMYLFPEPSRYTNHSADPNTKSDFEKKCDFAIRDIKKGEMITVNATLEVLTELTTFVENMEKTSIKDFRRVKGGYRNAVISYNVKGKNKLLTLKRINGNWWVE
jgi:hypothetical protein